MLSSNRMIFRYEIKRGRIAGEMKIQWGMFSGLIPFKRYENFLQLVTIPLNFVHPRFSIVSLNFNATFPTLLK